MAKELKDFQAAGKSAFLEMTKGQPANSSLAMYAGSSGAMVAGHEGVIETIDYEEVQGANVPFITADQTITIGNELIILQKYEEGIPKKPVAVTIKFDTGRTMTLGLLLQGQGKTLITFKGDAAPTPATSLNLGNIGDKLLGKRFKCTKTWRDSSNVIVRNAPDGTATRPPYAANCYEFVETTA